MRRTTIKLAAPALALALLAAACGGNDDEPAASGDATETTAAGSDSTMASGDSASITSDTGAAELRAGLTDLLSEHVYLASLATGAALRGEDANFEAFAAALNGAENSNTSDIVDAMSAAYGDEVGKAFDGLWRSEDHIPAFVAYAQASAADDQAGKDAAVERLTSYAKSFGETIASVNENLPADVVTEAITTHATTLLAVIDAQKAGDPVAENDALRKAYQHMGMTAQAFAAGTVAKVPDTFDGDPDAPASELRSGLHSLLREHVWLAASATSAAIRGDQAGFEAAAAALNGESDSNTADLVGAVTSVYGEEIGGAFDGLWRSEDHIPAFVAYTQAVAADDQAGKDAALERLTSYAATVGETLNSVNENLPADAVTEAITMHATTLTAVIDAQKAGDPTKVAELLRAAVRHMSDVADVLAEATVQKVPEKFQG